jgi:hypothetical protein
MSPTRCRAGGRTMWIKVVGRVLISIAVPFLGGCPTANGPQPIMTASGPMKAGRTGAIADKFNKSADLAFGDTKDKKEANEYAKTMLRSGFSLIVTSCDDYFRSAGTTQRWVIVAGDYIAAAGTLATSILALTHAGAAAVSATALGTSTVLAGTAIYTKDFLFASENMDSVRTLTMNALHEHQKLVNATITEDLDASDALTAILDDQVICTLPHIATLVRSAIRNAKPEQSSSTETDDQTHGFTGGTTPPAQPPAEIAKGDAPVTAGLKKLITSDLTPAQTEALYWLLLKQPTQQEKDGPICAQMLSLPPKNRPVIQIFDSQGRASCRYRAWPNEKAVKDLLVNLSTDSRKALDQNIAQMQAQARESAAAGGAAGTSSAPKTVTPPGPNPGGSRQRSTHINVDIL